MYYEPVEDNEYLADFYTDQRTYSFPMQIYLLNKRFKQQQHVRTAASTCALLLLLV